KLSNDQAKASTSFTCDYPISGQSVCKKITTNDDFYIQVKAGEYNKELKSQVKLSSGFTQNPMELALNSYLENCVTTDCAVPIKINSESKGKIKLTDLVVKYTLDSLGKEENNFYDSQITPSVITHLDGTAIESGYNLSVPLSVLGAETPIPSGDTQNYSILVSLDDISDTKSLKVNKVFNISELDVETKASKVKEKLEILNNEQSEVLGLTGNRLLVTNAISDLNEYQAQIDEIIASTLPPSEKESQIKKILSGMESVILDVPVSIRPTETVTDIFKAEPEDISDAVKLPGQSNIDLYTYQDKVSIKISATAYELEKYSGVKETKTLIKKTVTANIQGAYIVEVIPKSIAASVSEISFSSTPEIINSDPIVRWKYSILNTESISYLVEGNAMGFINQIKTLVVPESIPVSEKATCGNNICEFVTLNREKVWLETPESCPVDCAKKWPWGWLILLLIVLIAGIYYINWYRGKYAFKEITGGLFASKTDYKNLYNYIKATIIQKITKDKVQPKLEDRGWTKQQIDYIYRKLQRDLSGKKFSLIQGFKDIFKKKSTEIPVKGSEKKPGFFSKLFKKK
ncbi:MAG: hypothetical protein Q8R00_04970, partial [Candidatus Nanoarchaeia archaeon]|nr:hypothetical protein [Candidatus Nanoarchaeia archaeon]